MKITGMLALFFTFLGSSKAQIETTYPTYLGNDLGLTFVKNNATFKIWAPTATKVKLRLYAQPQGGAALQTIDMRGGVQGTWVAALVGKHLGDYYAFSIMHEGIWLNEVPDPYAKAVGTNGKRGMIIDLATTNPPGWLIDKAPALKNKTDAIIYELHVRDASIAPNSGIKNKGKFLGLAEQGTTNEQGLPTGLDHLLALGITHVHLLPAFDYSSVDETKPTLSAYNWGYDPQNYNTPEGSYSTNATDGNVRIKEFKQLIKVMHSKGLGVIMDVVYNHTGSTAESNFNQLVPGYYYRKTLAGSYSDASGCGNETASEKAMVRKFMLASLLYWVKEYHIDGFRFDLMGVHDIETINEIDKQLHSIKPSILLYGEGWTAGSSTLPESLRAVKKNAPQLKRVAVFSDDVRDAIKGNVFEPTDRGFVSGKKGLEESIKFGIIAATNHPQVNYQAVNYSSKPYANQPYNTITYAECHDNNTLWDRLTLSHNTATESQKKAMHKLAYSIVLTSQGIPFLHAGGEFLRTKYGVENSYNSADSINQIDWSLKTTNIDIFNYVKALINLRKNHPAFRMPTTALLQKNIKFEQNTNSNIIGYTINGIPAKDGWKKIQVWLNGNDVANNIMLDDTKWTTAILNNTFETTTAPKKLILQPFSCTVLYVPN